MNIGDYILLVKIHFIDWVIDPSHKGIALVTQLSNCGIKYRIINSDKIGIVVSNMGDVYIKPQSLHFLLYGVEK